MKPTNIQVLIKSSNKTFSCLKVEGLSFILKYCMFRYAQNILGAAGNFSQKS